MRPFRPVVLIALFLALGCRVLASQDGHIQRATPRALTNADVVDMLKGGISQEIVIAKIRAAECDFDTSPAALKGLKATNVPDPVILAMVEAPSRLQIQQSDREVSVPARVNCSYKDPVPVVPADEPPIGGTGTHKVAFSVMCGDRITLLGANDETQSWFKIRTEDGQTGYISSRVVIKESGNEESQKKSDAEKQWDTQKAADDLEDCKVRSQNEYETKMNVLGAMSVTPAMRVYASTRLKQNLDAELRVCRTQYELRTKVIERK